MTTTYDWVVATGGNLTPEDRRAMRGAIARDLVRVPVDRLRVGLRRHRSGADADAAWRDLPDSEVVRSAVASARDQQDDPLVAHGIRSYRLGAALADLDGQTLDDEAFAVACLFHDAGMMAPTPDVCFTRAGAEMADEVLAGLDVPDEARAAVRDAIVGHFTPGVAPAAPTTLAHYVQAGALADLVGLRAPDLPRDLLGRVNRADPRDRGNACIVAGIRREVRAVPRGRVAHVHRLARMADVVRLGPDPR